MELLKKIAEKTGKSEEEIWELIEAKRKELDYLISEEGALHIIASELKLDTKETSKVEGLQAGQAGVEIFLKVMNVFDMRVFERKGRTGRVRNIIAGDETGRLRVSLWDNQAELTLKEGDIIKVSGGYVKETDRGPELRVGTRGSVQVNPEDAPEGLKSLRTGSVEEKPLKEAKPGELIKFRGVLVRLFEREPFFESKEGKQLIITGLVDDGSASMRAIFFRRAAESLLGLSTEKAIELAEISGRGALLEKVPLLRDFLFYGKVQYNEYSDSNEVIVNRVFPVDPAEEVDRIIERGFY